MVVIAMGGALTHRTTLYIETSKLACIPLLSVDQYSHCRPTPRGPPTLPPRPTPGHPLYKYVVSAT